MNTIASFVLDWFWILLNWIIIMNSLWFVNFDGVVVAFVCLLLLILVASFWFTISVTLVVFVD